MSIKRRFFLVRQANTFNVPASPNSKGGTVNGVYRVGRPAWAQPFDFLHSAQEAALDLATATSKPARVYEVNLIGEYGPALPIWKNGDEILTPGKLAEAESNGE